MRLCQAYTREKFQAHSIIGSVLIHGALLLALLSIPSRELDNAEKEQSFKVEIIPFEALSPLQTTGVRPDQPKQASPSKKRAYGVMIRPTTMLSASALEREDNAEAVRDLASITPDERREQLCALEALEQIQAWNEAYVPERIVSYSFAEVRYEGSRIFADGATFWSKNNWHRLKFECKTSSDLEKVIDFAFVVGVIVPRHQWEQHNLTEYK